MPVDGFEDATILLDYSTEDPDPASVKDPYAADQCWVYATGISADTFDIEYKPNSDRSWVTVVEDVSNGVQTMRRRPEGIYRVTRSGNTDQATIALI
jgi:hypothetical protein